MADSVLQVAKIKLKVGSMELEYEGDPAFLTGGIEALLETMGGLASKAPEETLASVPFAEVPLRKGNGAPSENGVPTYSTSTIAAHLDAKTGPELAVCAMAQLEIVQGKTTCHRSEILAQMKSASSYYNDNMSGNLSKILSGLIRSKRINEISKDTFALHANERTKIEAKFADIG